MKMIARAASGARAFLADATKARWVRFAAALTASILLVASIAMPYWNITLHAPQYPEGLTIVTYIDRVEGDVLEVDTLNHYIGMMRLGDAAPIERSIAVIATLTFAALLLLSGVLRGRWSWIVAAPAILFPVVFLVDLGFWLYYAGHSLDPMAPLRLEPFTPPVIGVGTIWQFKTVAAVSSGFYAASAAAVVAFVGLVITRRPLSSRAADRAASSQQDKENGEARRSLSRGFAEGRG